jgi:Raf kinase inhibitor-like YbhB/YbcL family protein
MSEHNFTLFSQDLGGQGTINEEFNGFGCVGKNISPHLGWKDAPANTKSFALTMYDPDAPTGSGWWHWLVFDIPCTINEIPNGAGIPGSALLPSPIVQSLTDYGVAGYGGPCPPQGHGLHQYIFTLYALDTPSLGLSADTNPAVVGFNINAHTIAKASLVMYYKRD